MKHAEVRKGLTLELLEKCTHCFITKPHSNDRKNNYKIVSHSCKCGFSGLPVTASPESKFCGESNHSKWQLSIELGALHILGLVFPNFTIILAFAPNFPSFLTTVHSLF